MTIHILPYISRRKGNQSMKFGLIVECNTRNISPKKSYTKYGGELVSKITEFSISWDQQSEVL